MADIKGMKELLAKLKKLGKEGEESIAVVTADAAQNITGKAKLYAPVNFGKLRQGIIPRAINKLTWEVVATEPYSAYLEFGTGISVSVPAEMQDIASQFKGGRISEGTLYEAIKEWARNKGIPKDVVYFIYLKILKKGIDPHPFLYPAFVEGRVQYIEELKKELEFLTNGV